VNNGWGVAMSEGSDGVAAVLEAWMMGEVGGGAIADVLFGAVNPSGKLAESFPLKLADTPAHINFPGDDGQVRYGEGLFIGYRYYDARQMPVLFPFGYGLSYTTFAYSNATVSAATFRDVDGVTVSVDVTNTGSVAGKEVVQLYVHDRKSKLVRPFKELKGFAKVDLEPGETKRVDIALDFRAFAYYHPGYAQWITEDGDFDLLIGASSADIRATVSATLQSTLDLPSRLDKESTVQDWMDDPRGRAVFEPTFQLMMAQMAQAFGGGDGNDDGAIGMDMTGFIMQMPLASILGFQEALLPMPADVIVEGLLHQVHGA
ncbi:MAG: fibronectin type III-like domain-contianing protein, partial [Caldilineaceae bacterium]|nr:fibronectin type III-like domain-contianing protein [Caldilineaceae bacterium]